MSKLLITEPPLMVQPSLAALVGVPEAIVLQQLHWHSLRSRDDGWVQRSIVEWHREDFFFWSKRTINRTFASLRERHLVEVELVPTSSGREARVRVGHDALEQLAEGLGQIGPTRSRQIGPTRRANLAQPSTDLRTAEKEGVASAPPSREHARSIDFGDEVVKGLCELLARRVHSNSPGRPAPVASRWATACRRILETTTAVEGATAAVQLERVIDAATMHRHWKTVVGSMADIERNADKLWRELQPWLDPDAPTAVLGDPGGPARRQRRVRLAPCPVAQSAATTAAWEVMLGHLRQAIEPNSFQLVAQLHPHGLDESGWTLAVREDRRVWVEERFGRTLRACAMGRQVRLVGCAGSIERSTDGRAA